MRDVRRIALSVSLVLFATATAGVMAATAEGDLKMVFHIEGMV